MLNYHSAIVFDQWICSNLLGGTLVYAYFRIKGRNLRVEQIVWIAQVGFSSLLTYSYLLLPVSVAS